MNPKSLVAAGNTYNPSLVVLRKKGYRLWTELGQDNLLWNAEREGRTFLAYSPPELLGLVVLWEEFGDDWSKQHQDIVSELTGGG